MASLTKQSLLVFGVLLLGQLCHVSGFTSMQRSGFVHNARPAAADGLVARPSSSPGRRRELTTMGVKTEALKTAAALASKRLPLPYLAAGTALAAGGAWLLKQKLDEPSRPYDREKNTVAAEYDAWTEEGILEEYWGEHIHLGYYTDEERAKGAFKKDSILARYDFIDEMMKFGSLSTTENIPATFLDVGCGFGGTSRHVAKKLPNTKVTGITISPKQVERATELAVEQGVPNAEFKLVDALEMSFPDNSFDFVWACESGEHMPDKKQYIEEMMRVLKPGGRFVMATWCQRDNSTMPFTPQEEKALDFLYSEWTHPHFISIEDYVKLIKGTGKMEKVGSANWADETIPSWRHAIYEGAFRPWFVVRRPHLWWKTLKDCYCMEKMHRAFEKGLMTYGMFYATKKQEVVPPPSA
ncbi:unnamed protein product [Heterosigma akashiwo]|mmetsp:Transcript_14931/g.23483  ORF Transcript_14931/g.23483 Transcript_14931/m.23483 type:complete len:412 (-) Transcript_14931:560-1795(-)